MITLDQLRHIMPLLSEAKAAAILPTLKAAMEEWQISSPLRMAAFLAQLAEESAELSRWEENLNYSSKRLSQVWPKKFREPTTYLPNAKAIALAHNPMKLAEHVYGGRMGNGPEGSGDGWKYRGRGPTMLTGKNQYMAATNALAVDFVTAPDRAADPALGFRIAAWFWATNGLNQYADLGPPWFANITQIINNGQTGKAKREAYYLVARQALGA